MNDIAKNAISEKVRTALKAEVLTHANATELLQLKSKAYVGFITSKTTTAHANCSATAWEQVRAWTNSGDSLVAYGAKLKQEKRPSYQPDMIHETKGLLSKEETNNIFNKMDGKSEEIPPEDVNKILGKQKEVKELHYRYDVNGLYEFMTKEIERLENILSSMKQGASVDVPVVIDIVIKVNGKEIQL